MWGAAVRLRGGPGVPAQSPGCRIYPRGHTSLTFQNDLAGGAHSGWGDGGMWGRRGPPGPKLPTPACCLQACSGLCWGKRSIKQSQTAHSHLSEKGCVLPCTLVCSAACEDLGFQHPAALLGGGPRGRRGGQPLAGPGAPDGWVWAYVLHAGELCSLRGIALCLCRSPIQRDRW